MREVRLRYVPENATLQTPVTIEIDPRQLELDHAGLTTRAELRARMNDALARLVQKGLRATLATSLVLPGASGVALETVAAPGTGRLVVENDPSIIPAATKGSGLEGALAAVDVGPIAKSLRNAASSMETTAATAQESVGPIVDSLRNAAAAAQSAAGRAEQLLGSSERQGYDLGELVKELTRAAEAVRALATYLEENPDALLKGRGKAK